MSADLQQRCDDAARLIEAADGLMITAGAGLGVDSGLPDFRGNTGFWRAYPALADARIAFEEIACPDAFVRTPTLAWGFYGHRLNLYRHTVPHRGFAILQAIGARLARGAFVFTSNVDGQFQQAGFDEAQICEVHGSSITSSAWKAATGSSPPPTVSRRRWTRPPACCAVPCPAAHAARPCCDPMC